MIVPWGVLNDLSCVCPQVDAGLVERFNQQEEKQGSSSTDWPEREFGKFVS